MEEGDTLVLLGNPKKRLMFINTFDFAKKRKKITSEKSGALKPSSKSLRQINENQRRECF